jgi:hypothetical protein
MMSSSSMKTSSPSEPSPGTSSVTLMTAAAGVAGVLVDVTAAGEKNHLREENGIRGRTSLLASPGLTIHS